MKNPDRPEPEFRVGDVLFPEEYSTTEDLPPRPTDPDLLVLSKRDLAKALVIGLLAGALLTLLILLATMGVGHPAAHPR